MATIVTRAGKGSALTHTEMDSNFSNLNTDKPDVIGTPATDNFASFDASDDVQDSGVSLASLQAMFYPVGSIYTNAAVATNPATLLGFGTWTAFGAGRVMVGLNSGDTDFDTVEETGGAKTHTLTEAELPAHTHGSAGAHTHTTAYADGDAGGIGTTTLTGSTNTHVDNDTKTSSSSGAHTHASVGSDTAHTIVQPYIVVYMWKRTV